MTSASRASSSSFVDSSSQVADRVVALRPEDADKFVSSSDVVEVKAKEISDKIASIAKSLQVAKDALKPIQEQIERRQVKDINRFSEKLKDLNADLDAIKRMLHDPVVGIDKEICALDTREVIPGFLDRVLTLSQEVELLTKRAFTLLAHTHSEKNCAIFHTLMDERSEICSLSLCMLEERTNKSPNVNLFIEKVDAVITRAFEILAPHFVKSYSEAQESEDRDAFINSVGKLELLSHQDKLERQKRKVSLALLRHLVDISLRVGEYCYVLDVVKLSFRVQVLQQLLEVFKKGVVSKTSALPQGAIVFNAKYSVTRVTPQDLDALKEGKDKEFSVWKDAPTTPWLSYSAGRATYKVTGALADTFEDTIGQPLSGLIKKLKRFLEDVSKGHLQENSEEVLTRYKICLDTLEGSYRERNGLLTTLCKTKIDELTGTIQNYALRLDYAFQEAHSLYKRACKSVSPQAASVFKALQTLKGEYSSVGSGSIIKKTTGLYASSLAMKAVEAHRPSQAALAKQFDGSLWHIADLLREIHSKKDPEILTLTELEKRVPRAILSQRFFDLGELYQPTDDKSELPVAVLSFIIKRMCRFLSLSSPSHDVELELVLNVVKTIRLPLLTKSLDNHPEVIKIMDDYEAAYARRRLDFKQPVKIIFYALNAAFFNDAVGDYAKAWQRYIEYKRKNPIQEVIEVLEECLKVAGYPEIYPVVANTSIESWKVKKVQEFEAKLQRDARELFPDELELERKKSLFTSLVFRFSSTARYAKSPVEQVEALKALYRLLTIVKYKPLVEGVKASPHALKMVCESTIEKILASSFVDEYPNGELLLAPFERELLEREVEAYLKKPTEALSTLRLEKALMKLLLVEKKMAEALERTFTNKFESQEACDGWLQDKLTLIEPQYNPMNKEGK